ASSAAVSASVVAHLKQIARDELKLRPDEIERIDSNTSLIEGLQLDSLTQVVLLSELEAQYGIALDVGGQEQLEQIETVGDLVALIADRVTSSQRSASLERVRSPQP
ncbi:MAG: acyl carrier protein, partial [Vicinamibacteraceae bacterium]